MNSPDELPEDFSDCVPLPPEAGRANPALRERMLAQTTGVIRTRRRLKRLGLFTALAGCYLAGIATVHFIRPSVEPQSNIAAVLPEVYHPVRPEDDGVFPESKSNPSKSNPSKSTLSPAAVAQLTPYDRLRQAGDRQLEEQNDIAAAARTYRKALQAATTDQQAISVDRDSWLLMAMKNDQAQTIAEDTP